MKQEKNTKNNCPITKKGFSLVEVLATLAVLTIGLSTLSMLMIGIIRNSQSNRDQVEAAMFAQEGTEIMQNLKNSGKLDVAPYLTAGNYSGLTVDTTETLNSTHTGQLYINGNTYNDSGTGTPTKFYRKISLVVAGDPAASPSTRVITSTVEVYWGAAPSACTLANKCVAIVSTMPDLK